MPQIFQSLCSTQICCCCEVIDNSQFSMINLKPQAFILLLIFLWVGSSTDFAQIKFNNDIPYPNFQQDKFPLRSEDKSVGEKYSSLIKEVNFQISSKLYVNEGSLSGNDLYDPSKYAMEMSQSDCKIFPTDFKLLSKLDLELKQRVMKVLVIEEERYEKLSFARARGYVLQYSGSIVEFEITHQLKKGSEGHREERMDKINEIKGLTQDSATIMFNLNQSLYIATKTDLKYYDHTTKTVHNVSGYKNHTNFKAQALVNPESEQIQFYVVDVNKLTIYKLTSPTSVEVSLQIYDIGFNSSRPMGEHYIHPYFYFSGFQKIVVLDLTVRNSPKYSVLPINGPCFEVDGFKSTVHFSCMSSRERYLAEYKVLGSSLILNRFYTELELPSVNWAKRVAESTMALVGNQEIRILNYGVNRNLLLELQRRQPNANFHFPDGRDIIPLLVLEEQDSFTMLGIFQTKVQLIRIRKTPAEVYCQFPNDKPSSTYNLLLAFNATQCSYVKDQDALMTGSLEQTCQIWIPIEITSQKKILKKQQANLMSGAVIFLVVLLLVIVIICGAKYAIEHERKFKDLWDKLKTVKSKGYSGQPKAI